MKLLPFSRKQILRAIHAAALALFLAATSAARAQTATGSGGNVTVSGTGNTSFVFGTASVPPLASGGTLTITTGTNDSVTSGSSSNIYAIQVQVPATVTNSGSLSAYNSNNFAGGPATTLDISPITTAGNVMVQNTGTGTITASSYMGNGTAIDVENVQQGSISITNNGTLLVQAVTNSQANTLTGVFAHDSYATGSLTLNNTGSISTGVGSTASAYGANLTTSGSGGITVINSGTITVSAYESEGAIVAGLNLTSTGSGSILVTNSNGVSASGNVSNVAAGINATASGTGDISIMNSGAVSGTNTGGTSGFSINATNTGTGSVYVHNSGVLTANGFTASGIYANGVNDVSVINTASGTIQATGSPTTGINALSSNGNANINNAASITVNGMSSSTDLQVSGATATLTNTGALSSQGRDINPSLGINATSTVGTLMVNNSGAITASGNYVPATDIQLQGTGNTTLITTGTQILTATAHYNGNVDAYGANVSSSAGTVTIESAQTFQINGDRGHGILASSQLGTSVSNTGMLSVSGNYQSYGVQATAATGNVSATNSGYIGSTSASNYGPAYGITGTIGTSGNVSLTNNAQIVVSSGTQSYGLNADSSAGNGSVLITNASGATVSATSSGSGSAAYGIRAAANTGPLEIDNAGTTTGTNTNGGLGYGIYATSNGPSVVNNTGTATGTTYGIYSASAGTVNNYGLASGGTYSIAVPTASTVNLIGSSPVQGLIKGGADASSTSTLNFRLTIRGNLAAARAQLDAAIATYDNSYAAAAGVGNVDSPVVVLNNIDYQWEDFGAVLDNLVEGRAYANTRGFASLGGVLDSLPVNATSAQILTALNNLPDSAVESALAELSPKELEIFRNVAFDNNTFNTSQVNNHLANLRDGLTGFDSSALTIQDPSMDSSLNQVRSRLLAYDPASTPGLISDSGALLGGIDRKDMKSSQVKTMPVDRWSSFIAGNVILADLSGNPNLEDSNYTTGAVTAGVDYRLDDHLTLGALLAYAHTDADLDNRGSSATVDSYSPGLYASYVDGGWYGNFLGAYTRNTYTADRNIDIAGLNGANHGATSGNQGSANLTGGYEFHQGAFKFGPVASVEYVHLAIQSIQEQGPTALDISDQSQDSLRSLLGFEGRFNTNVATPLGPLGLTPHASFSWQHEYLDNSQGITSQFDGTGGGSFSVQTDTPDRDSAFIDVGLDATVSKNVTVFVDYETQVGQNNFFAQSAQGGVKIGF